MRVGNVEDFEIWVELNGVRIAGTCGDFVLLADSLGGLGVPEKKAADLARFDEHGVVGAEDFSDMRQIFFPIAFQRATAREAMEALRELKTAWQPSPSDDVLTVHIPGIGPSDDILRFYGRPRSTLDVILRNLAGGMISAFATFVALDPVGYGPSTTISGSGTFEVSNEGDALSRRAVIEIVGNGNTPQISNADDGAANVAFQTSLAAGQSWFIDLHRRTVVNGAGTDVFNAVAPWSIWPRLVPGSNTFSLTGAASATVTYRSGWW